MRKYLLETLSRPTPVGLVRRQWPGSDEGSRSRSPLPRQITPSLDLGIRGPSSNLALSDIVPMDRVKLYPRFGTSGVNSHLNELDSQRCVEYIYEVV